MAVRAARLTRRSVRHHAGRFGKSPAMGKPSATLHFEVGLLEEHEHVADFVGPSWSESETDHRHLPLVRTEVELKEQPKRARLYLSALGLVEAEINGVKVGNDALVPAGATTTSAWNASPTM